MRKTLATTLLPALLLALLLPSFAVAATLAGTVYDENLEIAKDVLVTIDTQPEQRLLSTDGIYQFEVPPGNYTLSVQYLKDGLNETSIEQVTVVQDGTFTYDLFLLQGINEEESLYDDLNSDLEEPPTDLFGTNSDGIFPIIILILFILAAIIIPLVIFRSHWKRLNEELAKEERDLDEVQEDKKLAKVLEILKREGGRMNQKELRKEIGDSEAKVSLLITELEAKGKVQKIKKGRGNILVLKKK